MASKHFDVLIIGGGVCGISTARAIGRKYPTLKIGLLEKETQLVRHQSNRNSQVLHAGMYYKPGSYRARLNCEGKRKWHAYCAERGIHVEDTGKLIIGLNENDTPRLEELLYRAHTNGATECEIVDQPTAQKYAGRMFVADPEARMLWSPYTATMDINHANQELEKDLRDLHNVELMLGTGVKDVVNHTENGVDLYVIDDYHGNMNMNCYLKTGRRVSARSVINCAGLYSDKIAKKLGMPWPYLSCLLKGYYMKDSLKNMRDDFPRPLLYPIPPEGTNNVVLGSHTTIGKDYVKVGPGAFPALWRENYTGLSRFSLPEMIQCLYFYSRMAACPNRMTYFDITYRQLANQSKHGLRHSIGQFLQFHDDECKGFEWYKPCMSNFLFESNGQMIHDFLFETHKSSLNVLNYNSPGWTSALATGEMIANEKLQLIMPDSLPNQN